MWSSTRIGENTMINRTDLNERVREWGLREEVVEKDYVIGWLLWGIGSHPGLSTSWAFKGGTCLKKCYLETYRFSEDLDFTVLPGGIITPEELNTALKDIFAKVYDQSGIELREREPILRVRPDGKSVEGKVYYRGPRNASDVSSIKLDLTPVERVVRPTVLRPISHPYPDQLPSPGTVRCYCFEELFAEKLRAMGERCRPRDLYDIINLFHRRDFRHHPELIRTVFTQKCEAKGVEVFTFNSIEASPHRAELETEWANMLGHQLPALPPFAEFWRELPDLFGWLNGQLSPEELTPIPVGKDEESAWKPPATVWVWGQGIPLESVRFAAANHLCIELGYDGKMRVIEPYSLRITRAGFLLLYAVKSETGELRAYRVDRIESINVTTKPFKPRFTVELTSVGPLTSPPVQTSTRTFTHVSALKSSVTYVFECSYCGKQFKRSSLDTRLHPHKDKDGLFDCPGRTGYLVNQY
jgi:predicted nucleotidyltransferase component of viral defense system